VGQSRICYVCSIKSRLDPALSSRVIRGPKWLGANPSRGNFGVRSRGDGYELGGVKDVRCPRSCHYGPPLVIDPSLWVVRVTL
jgi:hypothetical protein